LSLAVTSEKVFVMAFISTAEVIVLKKETEMVI